MKEIGFLSGEYKRNKTLDKFIMGLEKLEQEKMRVYKEYMKYFFEESEEYDDKKDNLATRINELAERIDEGFTVADNYARITNYVLSEYLQHFFRDTIVCIDLLNRPADDDKDLTSAIGSEGISLEEMDSDSSFEDADPSDDRDPDD